MVSSKARSRFGACPSHSQIVKRPHSKAEYMAAPERFAEMPDFSLAPRASSIHGT
jgi:hypothetical protein